MLTTESEALRLRIATLQQEHRELDELILRLATQPYCDHLEVRRLKKRKLAVKDAIEKFHSQSIPDLNA